MQAGSSGLHGERRCGIDLDFSREKPRKMDALKKHLDQVCGQMENLLKQGSSVTLTGVGVPILPQIGCLPFGDFLERK